MTIAVNWHSQSNFLQQRTALQAATLYAAGQKGTFLEKIIVLYCISSYSSFAFSSEVK